MDEIFGNLPDENQEDRKDVFSENDEQNVHPGSDTDNTTNEPLHESGIKSFSMDNNGKIHTDRSSALTIASSTRTFLILGWVCAAFTAFISPYFAIAGITFGVLLNRQSRGSGNAVIVTNIVLALVNLLFGLFLIVALRRMMFG